MDKLQQINKPLLSRLTHHVRNPFNGIIGFTDLLQNHFDKLGDGDKLNYLQIVHQLSKKALLRSENLAWWLKFFTGNITPVNQLFELTELVSEELNYFANEIEKQHLEVEAEIGSGVMVNTDKMMMQNIFKNIILNIIEFSPVGENVDITLKNDKDMLVLTFVSTYKDEPSDEVHKFIISFNQQPADFLKMPESPGLWTIATLCLALGIKVDMHFKQNKATVILSITAS